MNTRAWWRSLVGTGLLLAAGPAAACPRCRAEARALILDSGFSFRLCCLLLPIIILAAICARLYGSDRPSTPAGKT